MDNMTAGQELLKQKEERLQVMENALVGGLVSTLSYIALKKKPFLIPCFRSFSCLHKSEKFIYKREDAVYHAFFALNAETRQSSIFSHSQRRQIRKQHFDPDKLAQLTGTNRVKQCAKL